MKATNFRLSRSYNGAGELTARLTADSVKYAMNLCDKQKEREYEVTIKEYREKRSLTANAYFHVLCTKMAAVLKTDIDSVKKRLVRSYGAVADSDDGKPIVVTVPKGVNIETYYPYVEWLYGDQNGDTYMMLKQTHTMNTKEFARLLDATIDECRELNIEVLPDEEVKRLYAQIDHSNKHPERG